MMSEYQNQDDAIRRRDELVTLLHEIEFALSDRNLMDESGRRMTAIEAYETTRPLKEKRMNIQRELSEIRTYLRNEAKKETDLLRGDSMSKSVADSEAIQLLKVALNSLRRCHRYLSQDELKMLTVIKEFLEKNLFIPGAVETPQTDAIHHTLDGSFEAGKKK